MNKEKKKSFTVPNLCKHRPEWEKEGPERVVLPRVEGKVGRGPVRVYQIPARGLVSSSSSSSRLVHHQGVGPEQLCKLQRVREYFLHPCWEGTGTVSCFPQDVVRSHTPHHPQLTTEPQPTSLLAKSQPHLFTLGTPNVNLKIETVTKSSRCSVKHSSGKSCSNTNILQMLSIPFPQSLLQRVSEMAPHSSEHGTTLCHGLVV